MQDKSYMNPHATIPRSASTYLKAYRSEEAQHTLIKRLDAIGWGLFFLWVGIAWLANLSWGLGLLGVGVIILALQVARKVYGLKWEGFWMALGAFTLLYGIWLLFNLQTRLLPILCILAGAGLLLSGVASRLREQPRDQH
jgi:hypothetical protein